MDNISLYMVEGDTAPSRTFTILRDGQPVNLTGCSVKLILADTSTGLVTNTAHQTCVIDAVPATGKVTYSFATDDIASGNIHLGDIQITYGDNSIETEYSYVTVYARPKVSTVS